MDIAEDHTIVEGDNIVVRYEDEGLKTVHGKVAHIESIDGVNYLLLSVNVNTVEGERLF